MVEQCRNHFREEEEPHGQQGYQCPVKPGCSDGLLVQLPEHSWPQVLPQFCICDRRNSVSQEFSKFFIIPFVHGSTPIRFSFPRSRRTARKARDLTAPAEIPSAPISPNRPVWFTAGTLLGMMLGLGLLVLREMSDRSFHSVVDLQNSLGLPVLAAVPEVALASRAVRRFRLPRFGAARV